MTSPPNALLPTDEPTAAEVLAFLNGDGPLKGCWFGDKPFDERGKYWWRKYLRALAKPDELKD